MPLLAPPVRDSSVAVFTAHLWQGHVGPYIKKPWNKDSPGDLFECIERSWYDVATSEYVYGNFAWTGYDYKGETTLGWPDVNSHCGIHDIAGFPKVGANYYRAWWRSVAEGCEEVGISPNDWTAPVAVGTTIEVRVTTCAASADLFVNGVRQGVGAPPAMPRFGSISWAVPFARGNLTAVAYDADGTIVGRNTVVSAVGGVARLRATIAAPYLGRNASQIAADGQDAALITVELLDKSGVRVPNRDTNVSFAISGPGKVLGTTNGDPASHTRDASPWRHTFHGLLRGLIASSRPVAGVVTVHVSAPSLPDVESVNVSLDAI
eukprot:SAG31_NODE_299_length_18114_cov_3.533777_2_plen_321_part_00